MIGLTLALVVASLLSLAFDSTKWFGIAGVALLVFLHPLLFTALFAIGGVTFCFIRFYQHQRNSHHELPRSDPRRD